MGSGYKDFAPGDVLAAADVDGYLMRQTMMTFADAATRDTALSGVLDEGMIAYLEDDNLVVVYNGTEWKVINSTEQTYALVDYTVTGTFVKADYPWARSVRIRVVGGGGSGGGCGVTGAGQASGGGGGGGGGYSEHRKAVDTLAASETVTVGLGGVGASGATGTAGSDSSFGTFAIGEGGLAGAAGVAQAPPWQSGDGGAGGNATVGNVTCPGNGGRAQIFSNSVYVKGNTGGSSLLSGSREEDTGAGPRGGAFGRKNGGGGDGICNSASEVVGTGGDGADGIVIVELFG